MELIQIVRQTFEHLISFTKAVIYEAINYKIGKLEVRERERELSQKLHRINFISTAVEVQKTKHSFLEIRSPFWKKKREN